MYDIVECEVSRLSRFSSCCSFYCIDVHPISSGTTSVFLHSHARHPLLSSSNLHALAHLALTSIDKQTLAYFSNFLSESLFLGGFITNCHNKRQLIEIDEELSGSLLAHIRRIVTVTNCCMWCVRSKDRMLMISRTAKQSNQILDLDCRLQGYNLQ